MKFVYVRHAEKEYPNMGAEIYKHDPGITKNGAEKAREVAENLIKKYGEPTEIRISPFRRCRETGLEMASVLKSYKELVVDKDLSEFLGNHKDSDLDVTISTKIHNPPHPESFEDMKNRVYRHVQKTRKLMTKKTGVIWFITHGLIIKQIANIFGLTITKSPRYLNSMCIFEDKDTLYAEMIMFKDGDLESKIYMEGETTKKKKRSYDSEENFKGRGKNIEKEGKNIEKGEKSAEKGNMEKRDIQRKIYESGEKGKRIERKSIERERKSAEKDSERERKNVGRKSIERERKSIERERKSIERERKSIERERKSEEEKSYEFVEGEKSMEKNMEKNIGKNMDDRKSYGKKDWKRREYYNNRNWSEDNLPQDMLRKNPIKILSKNK